MTGTKPDPGELRVVPLGGLGEIGLNLMVLEYRRTPEGPAEALLIDCGVMFPAFETPGIDLMIPDLTHVRSLGDGLHGLLLTHGHEDHIGAVRFLLAEQDVPVYGSAFTIGLLSGKLAEAGLLDRAELNVFEPRERWTLGPFDIEAFHMTHSIVDASGFAIRTPVGTVVHTGDFKVDHTPVDDRPCDLDFLGALGREGVLLLFSDSTNAPRPGVTPSERSVVDGIDRAFERATGKVVVTTFASHLHRIQQVFDIASSHGRRVLLLGRSLIENVRLGRELGYLKVGPELLLDENEAAGVPPEELTVVATGSQGEPWSALSRIALDEHPAIRIGPGDVVIRSARVIPGNERPVASLLNHLFRRGTHVVDRPAEQGAAVHTSGHASREELKLVLRLVRPRYFVPVHGEYLHLTHHLELAGQTGLPPGQGFLLEDGETLVIDAAGARRGEPVPAGRVFVDGKGIGDVEEAVLRDRRRLSRDGVVLVILGVHRPTGEVVVGPEFVSRGVVAEESLPALLEEARQAILAAMDGETPESRSDPIEVQETVRLALRRFLREKLARKPMILPFVVEM